TPRQWLGGDVEVCGLGHLDAEASDLPARAGKSARLERHAVESPLGESLLDPVCGCRVAGRSAQASAVDIGQLAQRGHHARVLKCFHLDPGDDRLVDLLLTVETDGKD